VIYPAIDGMGIPVDTTFAYFNYHHAAILQLSANSIVVISPTNDSLPDFPCPQFEELPLSITTAQGRHLKGSTDFGKGWLKGSADIGKGQLERSAEAGKEREKGSKQSHELKKLEQLGCK